MCQKILKKLMPCLCGKIPIFEINKNKKSFAAVCKLCGFEVRTYSVEKTLELWNRCIAVPEVRYNPNHDPTTGRFTSGGFSANSTGYSGDGAKGLDNGGGSGIMEVGSELSMNALTRKEKPNTYIEPMPKKQLQRIVKAFKANGGLIQMDNGTDEYLKANHAEAITYNSTTILLKQRPSRASVFEELIHATQYRKGENNGSYLDRLKCEIAAQKKLLKHSKVYKLTEPEIKQTKAALEAYEAELNEYYKNGGV